jgi:cytochrome c
MRIRYFVATVLLPVLAQVPAATAADVDKGRNLFLRYCVACHAFTCNKEQMYSGPKLGGLFGRAAAGVDDYDGYSEGLRSSGIVWSDQSLDDYLAEPAKVDADSVMAIESIDDAEQRQDLIAFLKTEDPTVNLCPQD